MTMDWYIFLVVISAGLSILGLPVLTTPPKLIQLSVSVVLDVSFFLSRKDPNLFPKLVPDILSEEYLCFLCQWQRLACPKYLV